MWRMMTMMKIIADETNLINSRDEMRRVCTHLAEQQQVVRGHVSRELLLLADVALDSAQHAVHVCLGVRDEDALHVHGEHGRERVEEHGVVGLVADVGALRAHGGGLGALVEELVGDGGAGQLAPVSSERGREGVSQ